MVSAACASGNLAIANGYDQILLGNADIMIVGGTESAVDFVSIDAFDGVKALSQEADPEKACRPFDKKRSGFVMGEGAAVIILEEKEHAKKRGAKILAELVGYGNTSDAYHDTVPSGKGAEKAMEIAIRKMGGLSKEGLIYIHTHGTGTLFDYVEVNAIREVIFNDHQHRDVAISSTKGATGHTVGAAGAMGAIFSIQALNKGILPPTICLENPMDEAAGIDLVPNEAKKAEPTMVLNNSFGFGGFNVVTIFKRSEG
jgi:3-oxoacyl-[acyl-carrier-protein] synthase II